jgi:putative polyketide hydroxylase
VSERSAGADVLVVGGGLVGLAAAALLARQGARVLLAERHPGTSRHPKARLVNQRSMEIYRALGVEDRVRAAGEPNGGFAVADTLAGEHTTWIAPPDEDEAADLSPCPAWSCDQQRLEPILRDRAVELGADLCFGVEVTGLEQDEDGVRAVLVDGAGNRGVRARYAVAADGARSAVRATLGIGWSGEPVPGTAVSALFRADLGPALRGRRADALLARAAGAFLFARGNAGDRTWQLGTHLRPDWDPADLHAPLREVIRAATGLADLDPVIEDVRLWETGAFVADRFRAGRVFLAGDAAHVMPPYGGFGGNTGVQDAHELAWRLAFACRGDTTHLDSYEPERKAVAARMVAQALLRSRKTPGGAAPPQQIDARTLVLGAHHGTGGVEDPATPSGDPGTRAAHVLLRDGRSSLDLLDPAAFTVLDANRLPVADVVPAHRERWARVYAGRGVVVRPDGVIAARR